MSQSPGWRANLVPIDLYCFSSVCSSRTYLLVSVPTVNINEKGGVPTTAPFCTTSRVLTCRSCTVSMSLRGATHKNHTCYDSSLLCTSEWQYQFIYSSFEFMGHCNTALPPRWIVSSITPRFQPIRLHHDTLVPHCLHQVAPVLVVSSPDRLDRVFDMHTPPPTHQLALPSEHDPWSEIHDESGESGPGLVVQTRESQHRERNQVFTPPFVRAKRGEGKCKCPPENMQVHP